MNRGELYRVAHPSARDPKKYRVFVVVSRQVLIDSRFSSVICAYLHRIRRVGDPSAGRPRGRLETREQHSLR